MTSHMPPVPPANRSPKGPQTSKGDSQADTSIKADRDPHINEQGDSANIKQNTTKKGGVHGNRMK